MGELVHAICTEDPSISDHKNECYHIYLNCLDNGYHLLKGTIVEECKSINLLCVI